MDVSCEIFRDVIFLYSAVFQQLYVTSVSALSLLVYMRLKFPVITLLQIMPSKLSHPLNHSYRNGHNIYKVILYSQKEKYLSYLYNAHKRKAGFSSCHWNY